MPWPEISTAKIVNRLFMPDGKGERLVEAWPDGGGVKILVTFDERLTEAKGISIQLDGRPLKIVDAKPADESGAWMIITAA